MARKFILTISKDKHGNPYEIEWDTIAETQSEAIREYGGKYFVDRNGYSNTVIFVRDEPASPSEEKRYYDEKRKEQEERIRRENEQKKRDYERALADIREAKSKMNAAQTSANFAQTSEEFSRIAQVLKSLAGSFGVQEHIEECNNCRKNCEEKENHYKKEETLSWFKITKEKNPTKQTSNEYSYLAGEFHNIAQVLESLPVSFGVQAQIEECEKLYKQFEEKKQIKQRYEKRERIIKEVIFSFLYFTIVVGLLIVDYHFRLFLSFSLGSETRIVVGVIIAIFGAIIGFKVPNHSMGCLAVLVGIPIGAGIGYPIGYFLIGWIIVGLAKILWIIIAVAILVLSIFLYLRVIISYMETVERRQRERGSNWNTRKLLSAAAIVIVLIAFIAFRTTGSFFEFQQNDQGTLTITGYSGNKRVIIPETKKGISVTAIGDNAFRSRSNLISVDIPASITAIGDNAFYGCVKLISVTFATESAISSANFGDWAFPGNNNRHGSDYLRTAYLAHGAGTYTRAGGSEGWTKQENANTSTPSEKTPTQTQEPAIVSTSAQPISEWATDLPTNVDVAFQTVRATIGSMAGFFAPNSVNPGNGASIHLWDMSGNEPTRPHRLFRLEHLGDGWYRIRSNVYGVVDIPNGRDENNVQLILYAQNNGNNQRFRFRKTNDGIYQIYTYWGRNIHVNNGNTANRTAVLTWTGSPTDSNPNALWRIFTVNNGKLTHWTGR